jgi:hypothetical protein
LPTYDGQCPQCKKKYEFFLAKWNEENPKCPGCKCVVERLVSAARLSIFGDGTKGFEPHYQYRRNDDGTSDKILIKDRQEQIGFCQHQHLNDPVDLPADLKVGVDSKFKSSDNLGWI